MKVKLDVHAELTHCLLDCVLSSISDYMCLQLALVGGPLGPKIMTYI